MDFNTSYGPDSVTTTTPGVDYGKYNAGGNADLGGLAAALLAAKREKEARAEHMRQQQLQALRPAPMPAPQAQEQQPMDRLEMLKRRDAEIRMQAAQGGAPMKYTYPYGSAGFLTQDPDAMNAYQREMYLPQNSSLGPIGDVPTAENDLMASARRKAAEQALGQLPTDRVRPAFLGSY